MLWTKAAERKMVKKTDRKTADLLGIKYKIKIAFLSTLFFYTSFAVGKLLNFCIVYVCDALLKPFHHRSMIVLHKWTKSGIHLSLYNVYYYYHIYIKCAIHIPHNCRCICVIWNTVLTPVFNNIQPQRFPNHQYLRQLLYDNTYFSFLYISVFIVPSLVCLVCLLLHTCTVKNVGDFFLK